MALTLNFSDGTLTVSLINASGFNVTGWTPGSPSPDVQEFTSPLADGSFARAVTYPNVVEKITGKLVGTSHDNLAAQLQDLRTLLRKAQQYHTFDRQTTPVYMSEQATNETGARYALLFWGIVERGHSVLDKSFVQSNRVREVTLTVSREPWMRGTQPGTLPTAFNHTAAEQAAAIEGYLPSCRETAALTHIYAFDDSLGTFSGNNIASSAFNYFPASPAVNDIAYFGSTDGAFRDVCFHIGTLRTGTATLVWEYWTGSWSSTLVGGTGGEDGTNTFQGDQSQTGRYTLKIHNPTSWATTAINGVTAYWVRCRISAFTSMPAAPAQSVQVVYNARTPKTTVASTVLNGDVDALLRLWLDSRAPAGTTVSYGVYWFLAGLKTRGLTAFTSHVNFGGANPAGWAVTNGTDTSSAADILSPSGNRLTCTFTGSQALAARATLTQSVASSANDYIGVYRVFLRCNQVTGSAGDVTVQLYVTLNGLTMGDAGVTWKSEQKKLQRVYTSGPTFEVVDLGLLQMPFLARARSLSTTQTDSITQIDLAVYASAASATPDLYLYDLVLIPADEMLVGAESVDLTGSDEQSIQMDNALIVDGGLLGYDAELMSDYTAVTFEPTAANTVLAWLMTTPPPTFPPDVQGALYFLFGEQGQSPTLSSAGLGAMLRLYAHQRWEHLRGAD